MDLVCSQWLGEEDLQAMSRAVLERPRVRASSKLEKLSSSGDSAKPWPDLVSYLIAHDLLRVRIAITPQKGIGSLYHEKIGFFSDEEGRVVAYSGSANESHNGLETNFERVDVYASWGQGKERRRALAIQQQFQDLWGNRTDGLEVVDLATALQRRLLRIRDTTSDTDTPISSKHFAGAKLSNTPEALVPPADIDLFPHQSEAIRSWAKAGGRGVLEMATGSGKTITGLSLASRLYDGAGTGLAILIVAPLIHLVDQWRGVAHLFGLDPIRCAESRKNWRDELGAAIYALNRGYRPVLTVATTAATLATPAMQRLLAGIRRPLLIIADEMHNYGADNALRSLPENATYRLGLSATPDRWMDESGTRALKDYFGPVVFRYGLDDAIRDEVLTRYRYYPELVELEPEETEEYLDLTRLLARYVTEDLNDPRAEAAKRLLIKRARLIASARCKIPRLKSLLAERTDDTHVLVYCGDGRVEGPESDETVRQIEEVVRMVGVDLGMTCASYTAETPPKRRIQLLRDFSSGLIQVLVAIRCLDEGVDVPETRIAYILASSTNPRQFIQRRGRVLRRAPGKTRAEIHDFFAAPPTDDPDENAPEFLVIRNLVGQQIRRAREFAELAENGPVARSKLLELTSKLHLLSEWGG